jgi:hypothetical protein
MTAQDRVIAFAQIRPGRRSSPIVSLRQTSTCVRLALLVTLEVMERTAHTLRAEQDPEWLKASEAALRLWNHLARLGYPRVSRLAELDAAHT